MAFRDQCKYLILANCHTLIAFLIKAETLIFLYDLFYLIALSIKDENRIFFPILFVFTLAIATHDDNLAFVDWASDLLSSLR